METSTATGALPKKSHLSRVALIIAGCVMFAVAFDTFVGPGLLFGAVDRARYATIISHLHVGETREEVIDAFQTGVYDPRTDYAGYGNDANGHPRIVGTFVPSHWICVAEEWHLEMVMDANDRLQRWSMEKLVSAC